MAGSVVQVSANNVASGAASCTPIVNFPSNTVANNSFVAIVWLNAACLNNNGFNVTPTTSGVTWRSLGLIGTLFNGTNRSIGVMMFLADDVSSSISSSTSTSLACSLIGASAIQAEAVIMEITGILGTYPTNYGIADAQSTSTGTPSCTFSTGISGTGFVVQAFAGEGNTNLSAGSGYTLGPQAASVIVGQTQYAASQSPTVVSSFSGTNPFWITAGLWLKDGNLVSGFPHSYGSLIGF